MAEIKLTVEAQNSEPTEINVTPTVGASLEVQFEKASAALTTTRKSDGTTICTLDGKFTILETSDHSILAQLGLNLAYVELDLLAAHARLLSQLAQA